MEKLYITSLQNPLVKAWRALKDAKARAEQGLFLAEGDHLTGEALTAHAAAALLIAEQEQARYQRHLDAAQGQNLSVYVLSDRAMGAVCDAKTPQGVATLCRLPQLHQPLPADKLKIAALDGVQDPGNVGTILRTLDAFDFDGLLLLEGCADPWSIKTVRSSMGAVFRRDVWCMRAAELPGLLERSGLPLYGTALRQDTEDVRGVSLERCAIAIGSEGQGLSDAVLAMCRKTLKIPMSERCESLNAAIAAAVLLWESYR